MGGSLKISTPAQRRRAVAALAAHLERVLAAEERHRAAAPPAGAGPEWPRESERRIWLLEDAICILHEISF